jgi:hypothetical protein
MVGLCTYIEEEQREKIRHIALEKSQEIRYDVHLDLMKLLYSFPQEVSRFHTYPRELLKLLKKCAIAVQARLIHEESDPDVKMYMT